MSARKGGRLLAVAATVLLVVSSLAVGGGATTVLSPAESPGPSAVTTYSATDNVDIWERSALPFRVDTGDAAKTLQNGALLAQYEDGNTGQLSLNKEQVGVYQTGTSISASLDSGVTGAGISDFVGQDAQLVVARLEPSPDSNMDTSLDAVPSSVSEARDLLTADNANQNASFDVVDAGSIDSSGLTISFTPSEAGSYALFLAAHDPGSPAFSADSNGNLSVSGSTTIVGMDSALVEASPAQVSVSDSVEPGTAASFTVTPNANPTNASILLYERSTWVNSQTNMRITAPIDSSFSASDVTIEHSIAEVNGVLNGDFSVPLLGTTFDQEGTRSGVTTAADLIDIVSDQTGMAPNTDATGSSRLDASAVGLSGVSGQTDIAVPTYGNWSEGTYVWVVATGGDDPGDVHTATGTLEISTPPEEPEEDEDDEDDVEEPEEDEDNEDEDDDEDNVEEPEEDEDNEDEDDDEESTTPSVGGAGNGSSVVVENGRVNVTLAGTNPDEGPVQIQNPVNDTEVERNGLAVSGATLNFTQNTTGSLSFGTSSESTTPPVSRDGDVGYFEITHSVSNDAVSDATYQFTVSDARIQQRGLDPTDLALFRWDGNNWVELSTTYLGQTNSGHRYSAKSPALSVYAVSKRGAAQPDIQVTQASLSSDSVQAGQQATITATVQNQGSAAGEKTVSLNVNGEATQSQSVELNSSQSTTVTFTTSFNEGGDYAISVNDVSAGTLSVIPETTGATTVTSTVTATETVTETATETETATSTETTGATPTDTSTGGESGGIPGFTTGIALIALVAAALIALRRE